MFQYPRELNLDSETETALKLYLDVELNNHFAERGNMNDDILRWQKDYWAKPSQERKTFPYVGASNIIIPLTAIAIESIHARMMTTAFALDQFVDIKMADMFDDIDTEVEEYLDVEILRGCDFEKTAEDIGLEYSKFGTGIGKTGFEKTIRTAVRYVGDEEQEFDVVKQGPTIDAVALPNFIMPFAERDPQTSKWVGEVHTCSHHGIRIKEDAGFFKPGVYDLLKTWVTFGDANSTGDKNRREQDKLMNMEPNWPTTITWHEVWLTYDIDKSKKPKEIVVYYHQPSQTILSLRYNWLEDLRRPYRFGNYFHVEHRWAGIGVCKQNEQFQRAVTTVHRQRLDNATLANMRMLRVNKMSGYGPNEPIFPGKMWFVDNKDDIDTFQLGEVYPSAYNDESSVLQYSQQRTGANELSLGMPQVGTPGTATSDLTRVQEGSRKFDYTYKGFRRLCKELSLDTVLNIHQFGHRDVTTLDINPKGQLVKQFFALPINYLKNEAIFQLNLAGQNHNKILNRQNWLQLGQIMQQYYAGVMQLVETMQNPMLIQQTAMQAIQAASDAFRQICNTFDVRNVDRLVLDLQRIMQPPPGLSGMANSQPQLTNGNQPQPQQPGT